MDYPPCGERQYSITSLLHGASGFFQVLPIALTIATFMERRHPVAIAETPRRQAPYHAHVWECTMRMVEGLPCAWSRGYHAHVRGRTMRMSGGVPCAWLRGYHAHGRVATMRMSGGVPCAWSRGYHAHVTVSFGWHMGYETRDSMSPIPYI